MNLQELFDEVGANTRSYSGRAMYGKSCLAISGDRSECRDQVVQVAQNILQTVFDVALDCGLGEEEPAHDTHDEAQELIATLLDYKEDCMGLGVVYYWPDICYEKA